MATEVTIGDFTTAVPGVYAETTFAPSTALPATAALAVIKEDPRFERNVVYRFDSAAQLAAFDVSSDDDKYWARLLWTDGVAAVDSLRILNVQPTTQAQMTYLDASDDPSFVLKSIPWGPVGNKTFVQTSFPDASRFRILMERDGYSETFTIPKEPLGTLEYTGAVNATVAATWNASGLLIASTRAVGPKLVGPAAPFVEEDDWDQFLTNGVLSVTLGAGAGAVHDESVVVTITGKSPGGADISSVLTFVVGDNTETTGATVFASITSITVNTDDDAWVGIATVSGSKLISFDGKPAKNILADMDRVPGFVVEGLTARNRRAVDADYFGPTTISSGTEVAVVAWAVPIVDALRRSKLVTATRSVDGRSPAGVRSEFLVGGSVGVTPADAWETGLAELTTVDVNLIMPWSTDIEVARLLEDHCMAAALEGYERQAWFATALNQSLDDSLEMTTLLNTRLVSVVDWGHEDSAGAQWSPAYTTLRLMGMLGRLSAGESLTNKDTGLLRGVRAYSRLFRDQAIQSGLVTFDIAPDGSVRVLREVTSFLSTDDSNQVEGSAVRAVQFFVRDLRELFRDDVGKKNTAAIHSYIKQASENRAAFHVKELQTLVNYRGFGVVPHAEGDGIDVVGEVAPVKPLNFVVFRFGIANF